MTHAYQQPLGIQGAGSRVGGIRLVSALSATLALVLFSVLGNPSAASAADPWSGHVSPTSLDFGEAQPGEWSAPMSVMLTNPTGVHLSGFGSTGDGATQNATNCSAGALECTVTVRVRPQAAGYGTAVNTLYFDSGSKEVQIPLRWNNQTPSGGVTLSLTDGRGYGALVWAFDPDDGLPTKMRMNIPGHLTRETYWNYYWADMPAHTGINRHEAMVFLAQLPPGTHDICFDALDSQTGEWTRIGCRTHTVK